MFATLNLQLSSLDLGGEMLETPTMTPDTGLDFNGLLQLTAPQQDVVLPGGDALRGGGVLPQGGSDLPLRPMTSDLPHTVGLQNLESAATGTMTNPEAAPEVLVEAQLRYPVSGAALAAPPVAPEPRAPQLASGGTLPTELAPAVARPATTTARTEPTIAPGERALDLPVPAKRQPAAAVTPAPAATVDTEAAERFLPVDPPRRSETLLPSNVVEAAPDVPKARPVVNQAVQVLNIQSTSQQPQPVITTAAPDASYATALQQATETIPTGVRDPAWGDKIGERVVLMAGNQVKTAEIRLTPAELGPLRVQVSVEDGAANVTFQAQHAVTREAIEQALPRLRELLAENGLSLGQANVGEQGVAGRNRDDTPAAANTVADGEDLPDPTVDEKAPVVSSRGLVDTFA